ncbi:hypothetical protein [Actinacidiphila glaucinigra]|uniref:hypothetical protein n=1 Tax=Actinacidiphila glaucinigra TaxID=235986 RepID=UPI002E3765B9|nr:hypothetical protein [Actinacidiphila glaucinigra]
MEFTVGRTLRRRGKRWTFWGLVVLAGALVWLLGPRGGEVIGPVSVGALAVVAVWHGWRDLRDARRPFRLRIDEFGITLHDAELSWEQIDAAALWHYAAPNSESAAPAPRLMLWTAPGVTLPRRRDRTADARTRYTLVKCADLDQSVRELTAALAEHGGAHFETAPRAVRAPIPVAVEGPRPGVPGGERVFTADDGAGRRTATWALSALACSAVFGSLVLYLVLHPEQADYDAGTGIPVTVALLAAIVCWIQTASSHVRLRKPLRLRIGPSGIGMREVAGEESYFRWAQIATVTVGSHPSGLDPRPCLTVWPLPGAYGQEEPSLLVDGHRAYVLDRVDRLPGGAEAVVPVLRAFAGERYAGTA